jgi:hypothetical protein
VDDVKSEIAKKRSENKSIYRKIKATFIINLTIDKGRRTMDSMDEKTLTQ